MATQPMARQSAGSPVGGQFAPVQMSETPVELDMWDPHEGTFEFPPRPRDAQDVIDFWMQVEIPDEVCFATRVAYADRQNREVQEELARYEQRNPPPPRGSRVFDAWLQAEKEHVTAWEAGRPYPPDISPTAMRPAIRAVRMWDAAVTFLSAEEKAKVLQLKLRMPMAAQPVTVEQVAGMLRADYLVTQMTDVAKRVDVHESWLANRRP